MNCKLTTVWHQNSEPGACAQGLWNGVLEVHRARASSYKEGYGAWEDESTHAKIFCNQVQIWWSLSSTAALVAIFEHLSIVIVSILWLLYKQATQISTRTQAMGPDTGIRTQGCNEGRRGAQIPGGESIRGVEWLRRTPISPNNVTSTFFNTVHLLPNYLRFEHGGVKLASCPGRHLTSLRPCSYSMVKCLSEVLHCAVWVVVPANKLSLQEINQLIGIELLTSSFLENLVISPNF